MKDKVFEKETPRSLTFSTVYSKESFRIYIGGVILPILKTTHLCVAKLCCQVWVGKIKVNDIDEITFNKLVLPKCMAFK